MTSALIRGLLICSVGRPVRFSQNIYGSLTGIVTDSSGSVEPNALVTSTQRAAQGRQGGPRVLLQYKGTPGTLYWGLRSGRRRKET